VSPQEIRSVLAEELGRIAPEIAFDRIDPDGDLRDEFDIDSMDFSNLVIALHERLGVDIPESDYGRLASLRALSDYLAARLAG